jgi:hypothetical protein
VYGLSTEYRLLGAVPLSRDLAFHICRQSLYGKVTVVTDKPYALLASVRKQWLRLIRKMQVERARMLNAERIQTLASDLARMQTVTFSSTVPQGIGDALLAHVTFMDADQCMRFAPICRTMYITYTFPREQLHMMTSWMPRNGLVVIYE